MPLLPTCAARGRFPAVVLLVAGSAACGSPGSAPSGEPRDAAAPDASDRLDAAGPLPAISDAGAHDAAPDRADARPVICTPSSAPPPSDAVDVHYLSLGDTAIDGASKTSAPLTFELPAGVDSFEIAVRSPEDASFVIERLEGASGLLVSDVRPPGAPPFPPQLFSAHRVISSQGGAAGAFTQARAAAVPITGGTYTLRLAASAEVVCPVTVDVYYRTRAIERGRLTLALYVAPGLGAAPDTGTMDEYVAAAVQRVRAIYAAANLDIEVAHREVVAALPSSTQDVSQVLRAVPGPFMGVPIVVLGEVQGALGRAGGIPGDPFGAGTALGGIVVSFAPGGHVRSPEQLGWTIAHELGHHLGLHHTVEGVLGLPDQLVDTPDPATRTNLMESGGDGIELSPLQGIALRSAAVVRAIPR